MKFTLAVVSLLTVYGIVAAGPLMEVPEARATSATVFLSASVDFSNVFGYFKSCTDKLTQAQVDKYFTSSFSTKLQIQRYFELIVQFRTLVSSLNAVYSTSSQFVATSLVQANIDGIIDILEEVEETSNNNKLSNAAAISAQVNTATASLKSFKVKIEGYTSAFRTLWQDVSQTDANAVITALYTAAQVIRDSGAEYTVAMKGEMFGFFAFSFDFYKSVTAAAKQAAQNALKDFYSGLASASTSAQKVIVNVFVTGCQAVVNSVNVAIDVAAAGASASLTAVVQASALFIKRTTIDNVLKPSVTEINASVKDVESLVETELAAVMVDIKAESNTIKADIDLASTECNSLTGAIVSHLSDSAIAPICGAVSLQEITLQLRTNQAAITTCEAKAQTDLKTDTDKITLLVQAAYLKVSANLTVCFKSCSGGDSNPGASTVAPVASTVAPVTSVVSTAAPGVSSVAPGASTTAGATKDPEEEALQACIDVSNIFLSFCSRLISFARARLVKLFHNMSNQV